MWLTCFSLFTQTCFDVRRSFAAWRRCTVRTCRKGKRCRSGTSWFLPHYLKHFYSPSFKTWSVWGKIFCVGLQTRGGASQARGGDDSPEGDGGANEAPARGELQNGKLHGQCKCSLASQIKCKPKVLQCFKKNGTCTLIQELLILWNHQGWFTIPHLNAELWWPRAGRYIKY